MTNDKSRRRLTRLPEYDYSSAGGYYVTICTHERECLFGEIVDGDLVANESGNIIDAWIQKLPQRYPGVELDEYVIMPNHVHFVVIIHEQETDLRPVGAIHELPLRTDSKDRVGMRRRMLLPKLVGFFKTNSAKDINRLHQTSGQPVWQRNYYEHVVRNDADLNRIREYIYNNPDNWQADEEYRQRYS